MRVTQRAQVIIDLIQQNEYKRIIEVGVCKGETAMPVMEACELDEYVMIDPALNDSLGVREFWTGHNEALFIEVTSERASPSYDNGYFDLAFIDALHDEESIERDIHLWTPKVRSWGGIICGHDYDNKRFPGVKIAVDRFYGEENVETFPVRACKVWVVRL